MPDAQQLQIDAAGRKNAGIIVRAFYAHLFAIALGNVRIFRRDVNVRKEVFFP